MAAARLREMQTSDRTNAPDDIRSIPHWPTLADMDDPRAIYFSWYTFEYMFDSEEYSDTLNKRIIFATARNNVRRHSGAVAGASAVDEEVGRTGTSMIVAHLKGSSDWHYPEIIAPRIHYWLNIYNAGEHDIEFSDSVLRGASRLFGAPGPRTGLALKRSRISPLNHPTIEGLGPGDGSRRDEFWDAFEAAPLTASSAPFHAPGPSGRSTARGDDPPGFPGREPLPPPVRCG